ncbi:MAG: tryptophanase [Bdellovibrionaceae bacterium]|nr:tryptophanase [Bdellovibrionales bacterium]MCB9085062.1 tryptophanase [Pseudobdellovibrionaceae bacterium]
MDIPKPKTIFEPFRIKVVEPLPITTASERREALKKAYFNLFTLPAEKVTFDLLTDSGTSAMSSTQWAGMMIGDESYAGAKSYYRFAEAVTDITGHKHVIPTHQGRSAEALLTQACLKPGQIVVGNTHFDTTRANIESRGGVALDLPSPDTKESSVEAPFKGNMDIPALQNLIETKRSNIAFVIMTVTNNSVGGQPVSMENIRQTRELLKQHNIPMFIDAARFAENSFFIKRREPGFENKSIKEIAQEIFSYADGALMSAKKDAFGNIGGFLTLNDEGLAQEIRSLMVITEGFPTYGGLAGRDMEALAIGLQEILDENYLSYRIRSTQYFGEGIESAGLHVVKPFGGHAVYIDAGKSLPHLKPLDFPGQSLSVALYEHIGIRSVEIGSVMLGRRDWDTGEEHPAPKELVRLAIPRRVYTQSHVDYMIEVLGHVAPRLGDLPGYKIDYQPKFLRHFTARFSPLN